MAKIKDLLIISGFDPSGGAGTLRDKLLASSLGVFSDTIISTLTVQDALSFDSFYPASLSYFERSIEFLDGYKSLKLGLITDINIAKVLYDKLINTSTWDTIKFKILDPVLKASAGKSFFWNDELLDFMLKFIIPKFTIITPNKKEALYLAKHLSISFNNDEDLVRKLATQFKTSVFMTGGDENQVIDYFYEFNKDEIFVRKADKIFSDNRHGTGCVFSTALACFLLKGFGEIESGLKAAKIVEQELKDN